jgi:hypothetical protein
MTAKTRHKRAKADFKYPQVKARIKKQYRKRFKKSVTLTEIDKIWKAYLEEVVIKKLLSGSKVNVINGFELEVVGRKTDSRMRWLKDNPLKKGVIYKVECKNINFKNGKLFFKADKEIREQLKHLLRNTGQYFRIEQNESK